MILQSHLFSRYYYLLIGLAVFSLPFTALLYFFITPLLLILWIVEGDWKRKWNRLAESHTLILAGSLILFWLINIIGLFYSNDLVRGVMRTYDKLPFLVYPLVFFTLDNAFFTKERLYHLFKLFICATTIMLLICWGNAIINFSSTGKTIYFYYTFFSQIFGHPAYCALTVCIALCISFYFFSNTLKKYRWIWVILFFFFTVSIYFLQSRSGILVLIFILIVSSFYYLHIRKKNYWYGIGGILIVLAFTFTLTKLFPNRAGNYVKKMTVEQLYPQKMLGLRSEIWKITCQITKEHKILGIGTGYHNEHYLSDTDAVVINKNPSFINAHNQYLQTLLEHGILGFSILGFLILYSVFHAVKNKNYFLLILLIIFGINMFFESMLEHNKGIFAFSLFVCLFVFGEKMRT